MDNRKYVILLIVIIIMCCAVMTVIDGVIKPGYLVKSGVKLVVFFGIPILYSLFREEVDIRDILKWRKTGDKVTWMLAAGVFITILGSYFIAKRFFDFSSITEALSSDAGVTKKYFVWVALYICSINSFLEEFFFRGFAFLTVKKQVSRKAAYVFSAAVFALYHTAMMIGWFHIIIYLAALTGLFAGGLIFNYLNERNETIYSSWIVHMFANFAICMVGFLLFGIL